MADEPDTTQQQPAGDDPAVPGTGVEPDGTTDPVEPDAADAPEGDDPDESPEDPKDEPFDRKRFADELRKKNSEAANLRKRLKEQELLLAELKRRQDADKTESERLNDQLTEANQRVAAAQSRLVVASVRALASRPEGDRPAFLDPGDAVDGLDLTSYLDASGDIDEAAIEHDLAALLERKPHYAKPAAPPEGPRRPAPDRTQASGANNQRSSLTPQEEFAGLIGGLLKR